MHINIGIDIGDINLSRQLSIDWFIGIDISDIALLSQLCVD
jgi:hypothetical protein